MNQIFEFRFQKGHVCEKKLKKLPKIKIHSIQIYTSDYKVHSSRYTLNRGSIDFISNGCGVILIRNGPNTANFVPNFPIVTIWDEAN